MSKLEHWYSRTEEITIKKRPQYMDKLNRKQCNAIIRARSRTIPVKRNQKSSFKNNLKCRFCHQEEENQIHILTECKKLPNNPQQIDNYNSLFENDDIESIEKSANIIIEIMEILNETPINRKEIPKIKLNRINLDTWDINLGRTKI